MHATLDRCIDRLRRSAFALPLAVLAAALMLGISELGYHEASGQLSRLVLMGKVRLELARMVRRVADAESGQRGYLLANRTDYLTPYRSASRDVNDSLAELQQLYAELGDSASQAALVELASEVATKLSEMDEIIKIQDTGNNKAALELVLTGIGRDHMDVIRRQADALINAENQRVSRGLTSVFDTLTRNRFGVSAMTALSLLVLAMYLRQRRLSDQLRAERQLAVQVERDRLEVEVRHRTLELTELARHLETAREDERARLARDLHDELGALLTAAKLDVARLRPKLQQHAPDLLPRVAHLVETLNSGIALKRRITEDLRPSTLNNLGLLPALEILCAEVAERLNVPVHTYFDAVAMTPSADLTAFRLVQESLNNIAKHAGASVVTVRVSVLGQQACVSVHDDGCGFDMGQVKLGSHGLVGMRYRVEAEHGHLTVQSTPGLGTLIRAVLPLRMDSADDRDSAAVGQG